MIYIIMCTYNGEKYIEEQLDSIANNSISDWMLFVKDDCSTDSTLEKVRIFEQRFPERVRIIKNPKQQGAAFNFLSMTYEIGKLISDDDFVMLCDQDDVWNVNKIEITLQKMREVTTEYGNSIPLLVCSDVEVVDENLKVIAKSFKDMNHYNAKKIDFSHLMMENKVQGCTTMINKAFISKLKQLPKHVCMHDGWMGLIASAMGKIAYIEQTTMRYRQHSKNVMGSTDFWQDVKQKFSCLSEQKEIVFSSSQQVKEFLLIYEKELDQYCLHAAKACATLEEQNFFMKRFHIIKYHMWKSGILRNIGLMLLI